MTFALFSSLDIFNLMNNQISLISLFFPLQFTVYNAIIIIMPQVRLIWAIFFLSYEASTTYKSCMQTVIDTPPLQPNQQGGKQN